MIVKRVVDHEKKQFRRHFKFGIIMGCLLFCLGFFIGVHRNVIRAYIKREGLPASPHKWC